MTHVQDEDHEAIVLDGVDDAIVADTDSISVLTRKLDGAGRPWIYGEPRKSFGDTATNRPIEASDGAAAVGVTTTW